MYAVWVRLGSWGNREKQLWTTHLQICEINWPAQEAGV